MKTFLYPGSFDPLTMGHLDIIKRAANLCDKLIVGVLTNSSKKPLFSVDERMELIKKATEDAGVSNVEVVIFGGLMADYVRDNGVTAIVRGLRDIQDFVSEIPRAYTNKHLFEGFETVFLLTDIQESYLSSSAIKEILYFDGNIKGLVPENVYEYIMERHEGGKK